MPLKTKDGKLLTKAGKLSQCCCEPAACCLYPWPDPEGTPLYPSSDLPDEIDFGGTILTKSGGYSYGGDGNPNIKVDAIGSWKYDYFGDEYGFMPCLTGVLTPSEIVIEDTFPDELTFSETGTGSCTLNRVSTCCWEGTLEYTNEFSEPVSVAITLCYTATDPGGDILPSGWPGKPCWLLTYGNGGSSYVKDDPQSSPDGNYDTMTVTV